VTFRIAIRPIVLSAVLLAALAPDATTQPLVEQEARWWRQLFLFGSHPRFGADVSTAGDVNGDGYSDVLVGQPYEDDTRFGPGVIKVFHGVGPGTGAIIHFPESFEINTAQLDALFGFSVACAGDVDGDGYDDIVAGLPLWDGAGTDNGRVRVYFGGQRGLSVSRMLALGTDQGNARFGYDVSSAGDVNGDGFDDVLVGAPLFDQGDANEGAVFLYLGGESGLETISSWMGTSDQDGANLGWSVASVGDVNGDGFSDIVAGAPFYDGAAEDGGAVFVYLGSAAGPSDEPDWMFTGDAAGMHLGHSVSTAGDVNGDGFSDVVVGAPDYDATVVIPPDGRVFLFLGSPAGPEDTEHGILSYGADNRFGWSVASAGDTDGDGFGEILVGTKTPYQKTRLDGVYLYKGSPDGPAAEPTQIISYTPPDRFPHRLDISVASAGDVNGDGLSDVIVGDEDYSSWAGHAMAHAGVAAGGTLAAEAVWQAAATTPGARLGTSLASGDWNGDGWADLLVGAPLQGGEVKDAGAAFVYYGDETGFAQQPGWQAAGEQVGEWFGCAVADAGDIDGDGFSDVAVGASHYSNGENDEGGVFFFAGSGDGLADSTTWSVEGDTTASGFGYSLARAGDVNGDGYSDVIVGAFRYSNGEEEEGRAVVYYGSPHGPFEDFSWTAEGDQVGAWFGYSVAGAGDVNLDGFSDVVIGAPYYDGGQTDEGAAFLYLGGADGLADQPAAILSVDVADALMGYDVAGAGDVDGDGYCDILVGTGGDNITLDHVGYAFVFAGDAAGVEETPLWSAAGGTITGGLGRTVAGTGDVDGDGFGDILIGDPLFDNEHADAGRVMMFKGTAGGPAELADWGMEGDVPGAWCGGALAAIGDVDGDGHCDVGVGAPRHPDAATGAAGAVFVYKTSKTTLPSVVPEQVREDGSTIGLMGYSEHAETFRLKVRALIPAGATRLRLQYQAGGPSQSFESMSIVDGAQEVRRPDGDIGPAYAELIETIDPPQTPDRVKWRVRIATDLTSQPYTKWYYHPANPDDGPTLRLGMAPEIPPPPDPPPPDPEPEPVTYTLRLDPVFPNPFNPTAHVSFVLPEKGLVDVVIYNVAGERVRSLMHETREEGPHLVLWSGNNDTGQQVAAGVYWVRMVYANETLVQKMVLVQ
jgi:hypothetical protein